MVFIDLQSDGWSKHAASIPAPILLSSYFWDDTLAKNQPARVSRETRRKGKTVTVITGLDSVASNFDAILAHLKPACSAGGTINDGRIEIQADHRRRACSILQAFGYPAKMSGGQATPLTGAQNDERYAALVGRVGRCITQPHRPRSTQERVESV